ncbi:uncharacterized protein PRCAT00000314001 [Priceomyces carsonii]|uniref:uncharacterized protein n=1 Tax=Priceomyces carsonii TaxID=28549 RepID=UPI002ED89C85|nr:unnamed protein product [Priceomyces carsonii]
MSDPSSSDDEFSIISIIRGELEESGKLHSGNKDPSNFHERSIPRSTTTLREEDDFNVNIPSVFLTDAKKNESLAKNDKLIKEEIRKDSRQTLEENLRVRSEKQAILEELNDNGDRITFSIDEAPGVDIVENIYGQIKQKGQNSVTRHFFLYTNPRSSERAEFHSGEIDNILIDQDPEILQEVPGHKLMNVIDDILVHSNDMIVLGHVLGVLQSSQICVDLPFEKFLHYLKSVGADVHIIKEGNELPLKIFCINDVLESQILKLTIIFKIMLNLNFTEDQFKTIVKAFLLTSSDFNLNKKVYEGLKNFTQVVLESIVEWRVKKLGESEAFQIQAIANEIHQASSEYFITTLPHSLGRSKKYDFELHFNFLKLIDDCCNDHFVLKVARDLQALFISGLASTIKSNPNTLTLSTSNIDALCKEIRKKLISDRIQDPYVHLEHVFLSYYKVMTLDLLVKLPYKQLKTDIGQSLSELKRGNYKDLHRRIAIISKLQSDFYSQLKLIDHSEISEDKNYYKEDLVKYATASYNVVSSLCERLHSDLMPFTDLDTLSSLHTYI